MRAFLGLLGLYAGGRRGAFLLGSATPPTPPDEITTNGGDTVTTNGGDTVTTR